MSFWKFISLKLSMLHSHLHQECYNLNLVLSLCIPIPRINRIRSDRDAFYT
jgi:hypothetical protein